MACSVLECGGPPPLLNRSKDSALQSARGLAQSKTWRLFVAASRQSAAIPTCISYRRFAKRRYAWGIALLFCFILLPLAFSLRAWGQSYSIDWYKIASGGGTSTGATFQVTGTIGQPDAGGAMSGGSYSLTGGFWSLIAVVQTVGLPNLTIAHSGNSVIVSWPNTSNYTLQQNANLALANGWVPSGYSISTSNGTNSITIISPAGNLFFRLSNP